MQSISSYNFGAIQTINAYISFTIGTPHLTKSIAERSYSLLRGRDFSPKMSPARRRSGSLSFVGVTHCIR
jgi:hypothetical protein